MKPVDQILVRIELLQEKMRRQLLQLLKAIEAEENAGGVIDKPNP